jgi:hypothetical protein
MTSGPRHQQFEVTAEGLGRYTIDGVEAPHFHYISHRVMSGGIVALHSGWRL